MDAVFAVKRERAAGGVLYRRNGKGAMRIAVIFRRGRGWCLPKGKPNAKETTRRTALREVREETGLTGKIERLLVTTKYRFTRGGARVDKRVTFYLMRWVAGDTDDHDDEAEEVRWFSIRGALRKIAFATERSVVEEAKRVLAERRR